MHCLPQLNPRMFKHGFYNCSDLKRKLLLFKLALNQHFQIYPCRNFPPSFQAHYSLPHSMKEATASLESLTERCLYKKCAYYISLFSLFFSRKKISKKE